MKKLKVLFLISMMTCIYPISVYLLNSSYNLTVFGKPADTVFSTSSFNYTDPGMEMKWDLYTVGADIAHSMGVNGTNRTVPYNDPIIVAIIDTGVDLDHEDLQANILPNTGWDFVDDDPIPNDENGHGTHCAGLVAAVFNNSKGVSGIAPCAKIIPFRVLDEEGSGEIADVTNAINMIVADYNPKHNQTYGVDIISMSLGAGYITGTEENDLQDAIDAAVADDIIILAAAGNEDGPVLYPARMDGVLGIAATNVEQDKASYSNYGPQVDYAAPGGDWHFFGFVFVGVLSTWPNNRYEYAAGTSMATPVAAGVVALLLGNKTAPADIETELRARAKDLGTSGPDFEFGWGMVRIVANNWDYDAWYHKHYDDDILMTLIMLFWDSLAPKPQIDWVTWAIIGGVLVFFAVIAIYEASAKK
ncbi:MAG: S8 family serine peptidase [Promethearchaeota archaeon]